MIVTESAGRYRFVTQPAHAALSGRFARHWGNETFAAPDPHTPLVAAAELHDQGWADYDARPRLAGGDPVGFVDVDGDDWVDFYGRGVDVAADVHPYAGLLVSLHAAGLRRGGYGVRDAILDLSDRAPFDAFVDEQEAAQRETARDLLDVDGSGVDERDLELLDALHADGTAPAGAVTRPLWRHYLLLQALDSLSLFLCNTVEYEPTTFGPVPTADGDTATIDATPVGPATVRLDPYPFDRPALTASVTRRIVPANAADLVAAFYDADVRRYDVTLIG